MPHRTWRLAAMTFLFLAAFPWHTARAHPACPDILLGDSLAIGMAPHARALGFDVIAQQGASLPWLRQQEPRCARRLVLIFGTNDLRGMSPAAAETYLQGIAGVMERWDAQQIIWATPGCFQDPALERGSSTLDTALTRHRRQTTDRLRELPAIHSGRIARCSYPSHDGIHPTGLGYHAWWASLTQLLDRTRVTGL